MHALQAADLLRVWELGRDRPNWQRALLLLAPCFPDLRPSVLAAYPLSRRNRLLLALRESTVGSALQCLVRCPVCRAPLEFATTARELLSVDGTDPERKEGVIELEGQSVAYRVPNSHDLAAAASLLDVESAAEVLVRRAVPRAVDGQNASAAFALRVATAVESAVEQVDPAVDLRIPLRCVCGHVWAASLDIAAFLWIEIDRRAKRLLDDVQAIARGYGWHEADILAMSESRRQFYLEALDA